VPEEEAPVRGVSVAWTGFVFSVAPGERLRTRLYTEQHAQEWGSFLSGRYSLHLLPGEVRGARAATERRIPVIPAGT